MLDLLGGIVNAGVGIGNAISSNYWNEKNYQNQMAQQDYMKAVQQTTWNREDNAIQRRVADLKAAGLSPVLAAGTGASSSAPVQINAPQRQYTPVDMNALGMMQSMAQISQSKAQAELTAVEAEKSRWNLDYYKKENLPTDADPLLKKIVQILEASGLGKIGLPDKNTATGKVFDNIFDRNKAEENGMISPANLPVIGDWFKKKKE